MRYWSIFLCSIEFITNKSFIKFGISEIDYLLHDKGFNLKLDIISKQLIENRWSFNDV